MLDLTNRAELGAGMQLLAHLTPTATARLKEKRVVLYSGLRLQRAVVSCLPRCLH